MSAHADEVGAAGVVGWVAYHDGGGVLQVDEFTTPSAAYRRAEYLLARGREFGFSLTSRASAVEQLKRMLP